MRQADALSAEVAGTVPLLSCLTSAMKEARPFSALFLGEVCLMTRGPERGQRLPAKQFPFWCLFLKP